MPYIDVARLKGGMSGMMALMEAKPSGTMPFAPPFLRVGSRIIGQTANILLYIGEQHKLAPQSAVGRLWAHQLQLTLADLVVEAHDVHHPISGELYYEQQRKEALRWSKFFTASRLTKYFDYFENILAAKRRGQFLMGTRLSYVDLSLYQVLKGIGYAFPKTYKRLIENYPRLVALKSSVEIRPRIASYLASERRIPFNEDGTFRHYSELDTR